MRRLAPAVIARASYPAFKGFGSMPSYQSWHGFEEFHASAISPAKLHAPVIGQEPIMGPAGGMKGAWYGADCDLLYTELLHIELLHRYRTAAAYRYRTAAY